MSAAWKAHGEKDRRSNMVTSSMKAPAKKDGAGGSYTWGRAIDVTDYEPKEHGVTKVVLAPAPMQTVPTSVTRAMPAQVMVHDPNQFPALTSSTQPVPSARWAAPPAVVYAAPQGSVPMMYQSSPASSTTVVTAAPRVVLNEDMIRAGAPTFDTQHPRNAFARKPHKIVGTTELQTQAIDWTAAGTAGLLKQVLDTLAQNNPAHLGPYAQPKPAMTVQQVIQVAPSPGTYIPNPKLTKQFDAGPRHFVKPTVVTIRGR